MIKKSENTITKSSLDKKDKVLMAVFNPVEFDGRVKRAAETLNTEYQVTLFSPVCMQSVKLDLSEEIVIKHNWLAWRKWPTSLSLALFWLQFIYLAFAVRPKIVYSHDFYLSFPGLISAKLAGSLSVYDAHELIIPNPPGSILLRDRIYHWLEKVSVRHHDLVIAANSERAGLMKNHYALATLPTAVRNISKPTLGSISHAFLLQKYSDLHHEKEEKLIVYMGDVALQRGLGAVINALDYLTEKISLIVIGDGPDRLMLQEKHSQKPRRKKRIKLLGVVPQFWIQDVLSLCDVGVLVYSMEGLNNYYCSPNKVFEYAQAGLPVVTTAQPPLVRIINEYGIGKVAGVTGKPAQPKDFAIAITQVIETKVNLIKNIPRFITDNSLIHEQEQLHLAIQSITIK